MMVADDVYLTKLNNVSRALVYEYLVCGGVDGRHIQFAAEKNSVCVRNLDELSANPWMRIGIEERVLLNNR